MPKQASIRDHFQNKHDRALSEKQQSVNKKHALLPTKPIKIKQDNHVLIQHIIEREASSFFKKQRQAHMMQTKPTYPTRSLEKNEIEALMDRNFGQTWHKDRCCQYLMQHHAPQEKTAVLWKDKYLPNQIEGLLGNMSNYQFLVQWLNQLKIDTQHTKMGSNLILIVGKHGVGKTASIYTIAKEMGYSVFEINPSTKRSGKEVLDSVGGMTESHLVRFDAMDLEKKRKFEQREAIVIRDRVKKPKMDITRHFKPVNEKKSIEENKQELDLDRHTVMKSNYKATESLILLEEVDILFEEDKGFWQALIELSHKSKRPIIMTCNDDTQNIPYDQLYLQKILYFDTPTKDSLVPYLQLVCYLENYDRVRTIDIEYLCRLYDYDIRRILNTLQLWLSKDMQEYLFAHIMGFADLLDTMNLQSLMDRLQNTDSKTKIICQEYYVDYYDCTPHEYDLNQISHLLDMCSFVDAYISPTDKQIHQLYDIDQYKHEKNDIQNSKMIYKNPTDLDHWYLGEIIENSINTSNNSWCNYSWYHTSIYLKQCLNLNAVLFKKHYAYFVMHQNEFAHEYLPTIRSLCLYDQGLAGKGRTQRTRKKIRYLELDKVSRDTILLG